MATATTSTNSHKTTTAMEMTGIAAKFREQLVSTLQQGQKLSVKVVSVLPVSDLPTIPGIPTMPDLEAFVTFYFDVAADLLRVQRDFALQLTSMLTPAKSA